MRVSEVRYTRVKSDRSFGNRQATVIMVVDEGDDPVVAMAEARRQAELAVNDDHAVTSFQAPEDLTDYIDDSEDYEAADWEPKPMPKAAGDDGGAGVTP